MFETKDFDITEIIEDKLNEVVLTEKENTVEVEGMKAIEVHTFIDEKIKLLGRGKKVTISYLVKDDSEDGYSEKTEEMEYVEMIDDNLHLNVNVVKDGDVEKVDNVISVCRKVLNIQLWVDDLPKDLLQVNNHKKFLDWYLDIESTLLDLKSYGFKGDKNNLAGCLVYALDATSFYVDGSELSEKEYFKLLVEQMNSVL